MDRKSDSVKVLFSHIGGIEKMTLLDYPSRIAAILFYCGCNLRCPYCYNPDLINYHNQIPSKEIIDFLNLRKGVIDAIVFSGGECTNVGESLKHDIEYVKGIGYLVKIDTNGHKPKLINELLKEKLVDYVALDIKCPVRLGSVFRADMGVTYKTLALLKEYGVGYETRTTIHPDVTNEQDISDLCEELVEHGHSGVHYLQYFFDGTETLGNVSQTPRFFDIRKVNSHGLILNERNEIANFRRKTLDNF